MIQLTSLLLLLLLLFLPLLFFTLKHSSPKLPPGPNAWQVLCNISQFRNKPHVAFQTLAKIYGPLISVRLGGQLIVVASSPTTARAILKTHDRFFSGRYLPSRCLAVPGTIQSSKQSGGTWSSAGCTVNELFSSLRDVESKGEIRKQQVLVEMMDYLVEMEGEVVELDEVANTTVCNIFANVLASSNLFCYGRGDDGMVRGLVDEIVEMAAAPGLVDMFPVLKRVDFWSKRDGKILQRKVMRVWEDIVKERRSRNGSINHNARDFLDVLVENAFPDDHISVILTV